MSKAKALRMRSLLIIAVSLCLSCFAIYLYLHNVISGGVWMGYDKAALFMHIALFFWILFPIFFHRKESPADFLENHIKWVLSTCIFCSAYLIFYRYVIGESFFVFNDIGSDTQHEYIPLLNMVVDKLKNSDFSCWVMTWGTGIDLANNQSLVFDPFNIILYIMGWLASVQVMYYMLVIVQIIKCTLVGLLFYDFLNSFKFTRTARLLASYAVAFNGFLMLWGQHYFFGTAVFFLILDLYFVENFLNGKKSILGLLISVAATLSFSLYSSFMISIACLVYLIVRLITKEYHNVKENLRKIVSLFLCCLTAFLISGVITVPAIYQLLAVSSRIKGNSVQYNMFISANSLRSFFYRFFSNNLEGNVYSFHGPFNYYEDPQLFVSIFGFFSVVILFSEKIFYSQHRKAAWLLLCALFLGSLATNVTAYIFNMGNAISYRYTYVYVPFVGIAIAFSITHLVDLHKVTIVLTEILGLFTIAELFKLSNNFSKVYIAFILCVLAAILGTSAWDHKFQFLLAGVMVVSILCDSVQTEQFRSCWSRNSNYLQNGYSDATLTAFNTIQEPEGNLYRVEKNFYDSGYYNDSLVQDYYGVSYYNSTFNKYVQEFWTTVTSELGMEYDTSRVHYDKLVNNNELSDMLGIRYLITADGQQSGKRNVVTRDNQFGKLYTSSTLKDSSGTEDFISTMSRKLIVSEAIQVEDFSDAETQQVIVKKDKNEGNLTCEFSTNTDGFLFIPVTYDAGWSAFVNGEKAEVIRANIGFMAVRVPASTDVVKFSYKSPGIKIGSILTVSGLIIMAVYVLSILYKRRRGAHYERR